jgi:uncharacterized membrane protein YraQ (UPF0718 family)
MIASFIIVWTLVTILGVIAIRRGKETVQRAGGISLNQARILVLRMPLAILFGGFLVEIVPPDVLRAALGEETGIPGILLASLAGGLLPGGPFISYPIAVAFYKGGAGAPQMMALLTGWSIWAFHRAVNFELPMMGARFLALRIASSFIFPPMAGLGCMLAMHWVDLTQR